MSAVVFIEGFAEGKVVALHKSCAFLVVKASGVPQDRLIAVNVREKKILWETKALGKYNEYIYTDDRILIMVEDDKVVARNVKDATVVWMIDLLEISTDIDDVESFGDSQSSPNKFIWKTYNRCIKDPNKAKWFHYLPFIPSPDKLVLFRTARYSSDGPTSRERDWICINMEKGEVDSKGCYTLYGFSKNLALISDYVNLYKYDGTGLSQKFQKCDQIFDFSTTSLSRRCFNIDYVSSDWFFVKKDCYQEEVKELMVIFPKENRLKLVQINVEKGFYSEVVAVGDYILHFSSNWMRKYKWEKGKKVFWAEIFDLQGNRVQGIQKRAKKSFTTSYLGQTNNGDVLIKLNAEIRRYSIPDLKLVSSFQIDEKQVINTYSHGLKCFNSYGNLILCYIIGNKWKTVMDNRKGKQTLAFRFVDLKDNKKLWVLKSKVKYFKRKRNRKTG
jgi:hypothetical protein